MNQQLSFNPRRSLLSPASKPSINYRISRRNNSMVQQKHLNQKPLITHDQILELCTVKNYEELNEAQVKMQNKKLKLALRQLNDTLTYRVQRKKLRIQTNNSTSISMRQLMQYVPKDFNEQQLKNKQLAEQLKKQLETLLGRKKVIQNIKYRNRLQEDILHYSKMTKQIQQSIKSFKRMFILKQKQIKQQQKYNEGSELYYLRSQIIKVNKHISETQSRIEETEVENNRLYQKILILTNKYNSIQEQYFQVVNSKRLQEEKMIEITQNNQIYLENLNRLKNSKRRYNTADQIFKVKYYNILKKLDAQVQRVEKVDSQVRELEYQIYLKRQLGERMAITLEQIDLRKKLEQDRNMKGGFMITEIGSEKKTYKSRKSYSDHSQSIKSVGKLLKSQEDRCQSQYY